MPFVGGEQAPGAGSVVENSGMEPGIGVLEAVMVAAQHFGAEAFGEQHVGERHVVAIADCQVGAAKRHVEDEVVLVRVA